MSFTQVIPFNGLLGSQIELSCVAWNTRFQHNGIWMEFWVEFWVMQPLWNPNGIWGNNECKWYL